MVFNFCYEYFDLKYILIFVKYRGMAKYWWILMKSENPDINFSGMVTKSGNISVIPQGMIFVPFESWLFFMVSKKSRLETNHSACSTHDIDKLGCSGFYHPKTQQYKKMKNTQKIMHWHCLMIRPVSLLKFFNFHEFHWQKFSEIIGLRTLERRCPL